MWVRGSQGFPMGRCEVWVTAMGRACYPPPPPGHTRTPYQAHWALVCINFTSRKVLYMDSLGGGYAERCLKAGKRWVHFPALEYPLRHATFMPLENAVSCV
jgi:hypothetical protein